MNNGWSNQTKSTAPNDKIQNFLEALRSSQNKSDMPNREVGSVNNPFAEFQNRKEIEKKRIEEFQNARTSEWNRVYSSKEKEVARRIEQIRIDLQKLAKQVKTLDSNLTKAVMTPVVEAGEYHITYLEPLKEVIHLFSLKASQANNWLEMYNRRSHKMGFYWSQAKSKGSSYTQNNERSVATSIG